MDTHLAEQETEDYEFMTSHGASHAEALERLGIKHKTWERRMQR